MADKRNDHMPERKASIDSDLKVVEAKEYEGINLDMAQIMDGPDKPNPFGPGYLKLYALVALLFMNSTMNGFDTSVMSSINALPNYVEYYGLPDKGAASTGIVFAIWQIGQMVGSLFTWLADWRGRKFMITFGVLGVMIGTVITATAPTLGAFIGGRFILSFFATLAHLGAVIYVVEMAPTRYRGTVAGLYNTFYYFVCSLQIHSIPNVDKS
jgi:MFS family permease